MVKVLNREQGKRMWGGKSNVYGVSGGGTGGGDVDLSSYATMAWTKQNFVSIEYFRTLFKAFDSNDDEILPNNTTSVVDNIKAMVGLWTEQYLTALGNQSGGGGGGGGAQYLNDLLDVQLTTPLTDGQALVYNATLQMWVNGAAGVNMTTVWNALAGSTNEQINASHLSTALSGYVTTSAISDMATQTWVGQQGFATQTWVNSNFITIAYFDRLFRAYNDSTLVSHNDTTSTIDNIKAMFGFWTDFYLSALGTGGISSVSISLSQLNDVTLTSPTGGQALVYDATNNKWVNGTIQTGVSSLSSLSDVLLSSLQYNQVLIYDANAAKWVNTSLKTINSQSLIGSGDISVGGGASGNFLPITGGTLTGSLQIYSTGSNWSEGIRMHVASNNWCGVVMCGSDNTGSNGTSAKTWSIHNNDGDFYLALNSSSEPEYGFKWLNRSALDICGNNNIIRLVSRTANCWAYFYYTNETPLASIGYYDGLASVANEKGGNRIGVLDNGTPVFRAGANSSSPTYTLWHSGNMNPYVSTLSQGYEVIYDGWAYIRIGSGVPNVSYYLWDLAVNKYSTDYRTACGFAIRQQGSYPGIYIQHDTSAYGKLQIHVESGECSLGYYVNKSCKWVTGYKGSSEDFGFYNLAFGNWVASIDQYGNFTAVGGVTALSDIRHKTIRGDVAMGVEDVARMPAVVYQWNDGREDDSLHVGSIAQNWQTVLPEVVLKANDNEGTLSMQYGVAALVSSIIIARKVVNHEKRIKQLEKENKELKERLNIA